jgi:hypothetical protein
MRDITLGITFYHYFTTRAFATGIPTTLAGTPVISAYEDNNVTQITAGVSVTADFDSVTGLNLITVVATTGNGFENGKSYALVITTGTVGGVSVVGEVVGEFTIGQSAAAVDLANGTDGLGAIKTETAAILVDTNELQTDWVNAGRLDAILDSIKAETAVINAFWNVFILTAGTIGAVGNSTTALHLTGQTYGNDELNDHLIVVYDNSLSEYHSAWITDWDLASEIATVATLPFTPQDSTDTYWVFCIKREPTAAAVADAVWDEVRSGHTTVDTFGEAMATILKATVDTVVNTHTPTTTEFQADDITEATADHYKGRIVIFTSGVLNGQATDITAYAAVGGIGQFTVTAMTEAPANNDTFVII